MVLNQVLDPKLHKKSTIREYNGLQVQGNGLLRPCVLLYRVQDPAIVFLTY